MCVEGTQLLKIGVLPPRVFIIRKMESGAEPGVEPDTLMWDMAVLTSISAAMVMPTPAYIFFFLDRQS